MRERFGIDRKLEDKSALEYAINMGRGSLWLNLTDEQHAELQRPRGTKPGWDCYNSAFWHMVDKILIFLSHVLVVMFFTGLVGCVFMIIFSWIDICSDSFTDDE
jgi:hypothetical protein